MQQLQFASGLPETELYVKKIFESIYPKQDARMMRFSVRVYSDVQRKYAWCLKPVRQNGSDYGQ